MQLVTLSGDTVIATGTGDTSAPDWVQCGDQLINGVWTVGNVRRITAIKTACGEHILAALPIWKQINLTARFSELMFKTDRTQSETDEMAALLQVWDDVKACRALSNTLEADSTKTASDATWPTIRVP